MGLSSLMLAAVMGVSFLEGILCQEFRLEGPSEILPGIYPGDLWGDLGASLSELQPVFLLVDSPMPRAPLYAEPPRRGNGRHRNSPPNRFRPPPEDSVVPSHSQRSVKVLSDLGVLNRPHQNLRTEISYGNYVPIAFRNNDPPKPNFEQNRPSLETNLHTLEGLISLPIRDNGEFKLSASRFQNTGHHYDRLRNAKIRDEMEPRMRHRNPEQNHHQPRPVASKPAGNFVEYRNPSSSEQQVPNRPAERIFKNRVHLRPPVQVNVRPSSYNHDGWKSSSPLQNDLPSDSVAAQNALNTSRVTIYTDFRNIFESGTPLELNAKSSPDSESSFAKTFDSKSLENVIKDIAPPDVSSERQNYLSRSLVTTRRPSSAPFVASRFRNAPQSAPRHEQPAYPPVALPPLETKEERSHLTVEAFDLKSLYQEDPEDNSKVQFDDEVSVRNSSSFIGSPSISSSVTINANTVAKPNKPLAGVAKPPTIAKPLAKKPIKKKQQKKVEKEPEEEIQGIPGTDYPTFSDIPDTRFKCDGPGFYADLDTGCQVFHNCDAGGQKHSFLCPNGTVFRQELFICDWWYNVRCELSQEHFPLNDGLFPSSKTA